MLLTLVVAFIAARKAEKAGSIHGLFIGNTMKTYIVRDPEAVEPQNRKRQPLPPPQPSDPAITAIVDVICGPAAPVPPALGDRVLYIGLDVHNDTIAVSLAPSNSTEMRTLLK